MLRAMFSGRLDVLVDADGWVLIDRSGAQFALILNYLRDGDVALPDCQHSVALLLQEAKYYCLQVRLMPNDVCESFNAISLVYAGIGGFVRDLAYGASAFC